MLLSVWAFRFQGNTIINIKKSQHSCNVSFKCMLRMSNVHYLSYLIVKYFSQFLDRSVKGEVRQRSDGFIILASIFLLFSFFPRSCKPLVQFYFLVLDIIIVCLYSSTWCTYWRRFLILRKSQGHLKNCNHYTHR